jgi:hypothetical protein
MQITVHPSGGLNPLGLPLHATSGLPSHCLASTAPRSWACADRQRLYAAAARHATGEVAFTLKRPGCDRRLGSFTQCILKINHIVHKRQM